MSKFERNLLLGRIGEHIVERILVKAGFQVVPFGYERIAASVTDRVKADRSETGTRIRSTPDFLVVNVESKSYLVQVKTTIEPGDYYTLHNKNYPEKDHWPQAIFFIVNLHPDHNAIYVVERWCDKESYRVYVYYGEDKPNRGRSVRLEGYTGLGQMICKEDVDEIMAGYNALVSQFIKSSKPKTLSSVSET